MKCLSLRQWTKSFETDFIIYNWFELITECIQIEFLIFFGVRNTNFADCLSKIICFPRKPVTDKNSLWDLFLNIRPNCKSNMYGDLKRINSELLFIQICTKHETCGYSVLFECKLCICCLLSEILSTCLIRKRKLPNVMLTKQPIRIVLGGLSRNTYKTAKAMKQSK